MKALRKLYDHIEINVRSLKSLGIDFAQYGTLLIPMVMTKIPEEIRLQVAKKIGKENWELDQVLANLKIELEAWEACGQLHVDRQSGSHFKSSRSSFSQSTTSALLSSGGKITCSFCKNSHQSARCHVVTDPKMRRDLLRKYGKCFRCLKRGHLARECTSNIMCFNCKQKHHVSLCQFKSLEKSGGPNQNNVPQSVAPLPTSITLPESKVVSIHPTGTNPSLNNPSGYQQVHQPVQQPVQQNLNLTNLYVETKNSVLLQTAKGYISAPNDSANMALARLLFDGGSECSFVLTRLKDALALPVIGQETLIIKTFGSDQGTLQTCDIVQFCVRSPYNDLNIYVNVYVTPVVCAALRNQAIEFAASSYAHLASLPLADFPVEGEEDLSIDILIGSNYYWLFLSGMSIRGRIIVMGQLRLIHDLVGYFLGLLVDILVFHLYQ